MQLSLSLVTVPTTTVVFGGFTKYICRYSIYLGRPKECDWIIYTQMHLKWLVISAVVQKKKKKMNKCNEIL